MMTFYSIGPRDLIIIKYAKINWIKTFVMDSKINQNPIRWHKNDDDDDDCASNCLLSWDHIFRVLRLHLSTSADKEQVPTL